jgi:DNA-binding transcriptional LysR family regulator
MDRSDVTLERMRTFVRVAERGNLSAVAREFSVGQSTITRHLRELEASVGVSLLSRTTRRVTMTDEGSRYYANSVQILRLVDQAVDEARGERGAPAGSIRVSCTAAFGVLHVSRLIFEIDLSLTDQRVDLVREGIDIALRLGPLADSSMKLRSLGQCRRVLVAAPDYLAARGRPADPRDLSGHEAVRMSNVAGSDTLALCGPDGETRVALLGGRFRVDLALALREALVAGRGIGHAHRWLVDDLLATGQLQEILPDHRLSSVPLSLLIVPERAGVSRVRLLIEFLTEQISAIPGIEQSRYER